MMVASTGVWNRGDRSPSEAGSAPVAAIPKPDPRDDEPGSGPGDYRQGDRESRSLAQVPPITCPMYTNGAAALACKAGGETAP